MIAGGSRKELEDKLKQNEAPMKLKIQIFDQKIDISESPVIQLFIDNKPALVGYSVIKAAGVVTIHMSAGFRNKTAKKKK